MGRLDYSLVTKRRWLWPLVDIAHLLLSLIAQYAQQHEATQAARCRAQHCQHEEYRR